MLGFTPQACKPCACPASTLKKQTGVSDRDISGSMDEGPYMPEARSWSDSAADNEQDMAAVFAGCGGGAEREVTS